MKTPEEIRVYLFGTQLSLFTWIDINRAIKQAQIEGYNEALKDAVKNVKISGYYSEPNKTECFNLKKFKRIWENRLFKVETNITIDKDSILKLKK